MHLQLTSFIFHRTPASVNEYVINRTTLTVFADIDARLFEHLGERQTGELAILFGIEDSRCAVVAERRLDGFHTKAAKICATRPESTLRESQTIVVTK